MEINFKDKQYKLKYSFRALMIYENITQKSFNPKGIGDVMIFFYSVLIASAKDTTLSFDDFLDWLDEHPTAINDFSLWLTEVFAQQAAITNQGIKVEADKAEETEKN